MYIYIYIWLVLRGLLVARNENLAGVSTGLTGRLKNLDPTGAGQPYRFPLLVHREGIVQLIDWTIGPRKTQGNDNDPRKTRL